MFLRSGCACRSCWPRPIFDLKFLSQIVQGNCASVLSATEGSASTELMRKSVSAWSSGASGDVADSEATASDGSAFRSSPSCTVLLVSPFLPFSTFREVAGCLPQTISVCTACGTLERQEHVAVLCLEVFGQVLCLCKDFPAFYAGTPVKWNKDKRRVIILDPNLPSGFIFTAL